VPERIVVAARVSKGGDATARAGDLEGVSAPVAPDAGGVTVTIDRVRE
jgi:cytochrome c-type biogenesis protein CcmH